MSLTRFVENFSTSFPWIVVEIHVAGLAIHESHRALRFRTAVVWTMMRSCLDR